MALRVLNMMAFKPIILLAVLLPSAQLLYAESSQHNAGFIHQTLNDYKPWQSGKGMAAHYQIKPVSDDSRRELFNRWKKQSFVYGAGHHKQVRPWGNVPSRRAKSAKGMRYFDEKFKQSSHQFDASYAQQLPSPNYSSIGGMNHAYGTSPYGVYPPHRYFRNNTGLFGFMNNFMPW